MDTHLSVNEQNAVAAMPVFDGRPHRIRAVFEPHPDCANDTRVVGFVDGKEAFRVDRRKGRVGFSSVAENLLTVNCGRAPFAGRVRDLRVTKTR